MNNRELEKITISYAALLSVTEVGLGSLLHAFHVPFTGQFLSLNQIAILSHATVASKHTSVPLSISAIAALLKSLSPIGKRVTPMLALSMQGLLYTLGIAIGGKGAFGRAFGALLSSLWSFLQPLLLYSIIFGKNIWEALFFVNSKYLPEHLLVTLFCIAVSLKIIAAICTALFAPKVPLSFFEKISSAFKTKNDSISLSTNLKRSFKDIFRPSFLLLFALLAFLIINTLQESDAIALILLRPIAVGFLVSMVFRHLPVEKLFMWLSRRGNSPFQRTLQATLETLAAKNKTQ